MKGGRSSSSLGVMAWRRAKAFSADDIGGSPSTWLTYTRIHSNYEAHFAQAIYAAPFTTRCMAKRATKMTELTAVRFTQEQAKAIEDWRREQPTIPAKGVAIRDLVQAGLDAYKGKLPKKMKPQ
jgi:hypothetical protein